MHTEKKPNLLKCGIWAIAAIWAMFDFFWLYTRVPLSSGTFLEYGFWIAIIPIAWWLGKIFSRFLLSEYAFKRHPKAMGVFRSISIVCFGISVLMVLTVKLAMALGEDTGEVGVPYPVVMFVMLAAAFYFSLKNRFAQSK